jgi:hypothetical protein
VYDQTNPVNMVKFWKSRLCQSIENLLTIFSHLLMPDFCPHFLWLSVNWSSYRPIHPVLVRLLCSYFPNSTILSSPLPYLWLFPGLSPQPTALIFPGNTKLDLHQRVRVPVQILLLTFSDTLGKSVALSGPSFSHILS